MALGMFENATYAAGRVDLAPGDVLVMYSDGITEAEDDFERPFDEAGVQAVVDGAEWASAKELGWAMFAAVEAHRQERRLLDDLTVLVARRLRRFRSPHPPRASWRLIVPGPQWSNHSSSDLPPRVCRSAGRPGAGADPDATAIRKFERSLNAADRAESGCAVLPTVPAPQVQAYTNDLLLPGAVRTIVRERDRLPLEGVPPGDGYGLIIEFFVETPGKARILTAGMDIRRPTVATSTRGGLSAPSADVGGGSLQASTEHAPPDGGAEPGGHVRGPRAVASGRCPSSSSSPTRV
jgi:hypothetical protein